MKIAGFFPGQGSQKVGMGHSLCEEFEIAKQLFETADKVLGFPLSKIAFDGPIETLTLTENAQPALLISTVAAFRASDITINAAAGHSLGEYSTLVAAKALGFEDAVALVHKRGKYMQEAVAPGVGKMIAVLGPSEAEISDILAGMDSVVAEIANLNSPGQTVLAGNNIGIDTCADALKSAGAKIIPLNVSAPFHCSLMKPAAEKLALDLDNTNFITPAFPVYANVTAKQIQNADEARELLKQQVCSSVRWTDSVTTMIAEHNITHTIEFGLGGVLSKLMKRINKEITRLEAYDRPSIEKARDCSS